MPGGGRFPVRSSQQHEPVIQAVQQLRQPECLYPRGGQLDRQRHPVQLGDQLCHRRGGVGAERELPVGAAGPVGEQRHRLGARNSGRIIRRGQRQGGQPVPGLAGNAERLTAGRQDPHVIGDLEQRRAHLGGRPGHVLTAVQHEQHLLATEHFGQRIRHRDARLLANAQHGCRGRRYLRGIQHRCQLHQPHAVGEPVGHSLRNFGGQPRLPHPARPGYRHEPAFI